MSNIIKRFETHSHTEYSNLRLLDCINKPEKLIDRAIELGLSGIAITDHECLSSHMQVNIYSEKIREKNPDFKIALGNEIYLCETRESGQKYYHFILIAKNKMGHRALRELSSRAWMNAYSDRGMQRVVTLYSDLEEIVNKYPNSLIATTACLGGELSSATVELVNCEVTGDNMGATAAHQHIVNFMLFCKKLFGDDFYVECAPGTSADQIKANIRLKAIAKAFDVKMVIGTDAHYLTKEDRFVHKAFLNSKGGEREVDEFYEFAYLQSEEEIQKNLAPSSMDYEQMVANSYEIYEKIENYSLRHNQTIPKVAVKDYPKNQDWIPGFQITRKMHINENYPILQSMLTSDDKMERYWVNQCLDALVDKNLYKEKYLDRLEEEADIKRVVGKELGTNMFSYPVTLQHYIDLFWNCGSLVGAGRGSSCSGLNHFLLGITQLDPLEWDLPFWRYLNKKRLELGDIDLDLCPSKRPAIINEIKKERGKNFNSDIDDLSKENLGCTLIATFGTESTKATIGTACRGYRSEEYPDGIDPDTSAYLSSLIPQERGFVWSLNDVVYGNPEKDRKPVKTFVNEVQSYPGLLDIMFGIEGLISRRGSHASGVIMFDEDPYEFGCFMKAPNGDIITQYDLHMCEAAGMTKYDFLLTEVQDKLLKAIQLLQEDGEIEKDLSLREVYDKYFHPTKLPLDDKRIWDALSNNSVLNIFQFDSDVGSQAAKKIRPHNILEMADANGLMRLMTSEKGAETPMEKYIRYKNDISLWYKEMDDFGLTKEEQKTLEPYFLKSYGVPPSQEQLMQMLMDENICGFNLEEANAARKIVGKKQMSKIPQLKKDILEKAKRKTLGEYVWKYGVGPQMGYSFSVIHALAYSFIGVQSIYIATNWNPIYWNTACLIVNSGSLDEDDDTERKEKNADYGKIAKALCDTIGRGIKVSLIDINKSDYSFKPNIETNEILFGMKALSGINKATIDLIKAGRPYVGIKDFMQRCPLNKKAMVSLIKSGAFDRLEEDWGKQLKVSPRIVIMTYYLSIVSEPKKRLTLQNFNGLIQRNLIPKELDFEKRVFIFNKYLKTYKKVGQYYVFDEPCETFYNTFFDIEQLEVINGCTCIIQKTWDKIYKECMDKARNYLKDNQESMLKKFNELLFKEQWEKYASGNISSWEMESLCFYYHEHELQEVNVNKYGIVNFFNLPTNPEVDYFFKRNGRQIPIYKTYKIIGTVISKNDTKSSISLLTTDGVVNVKFTKEYYAMFNKQISEKQEDGTKKIKEKGWFTRGTKVMCTGFRRDDMFVTKSYKNTPTHQLYKITEVVNGDINLIHDRYNAEEN